MKVLHVYNPDHGQLARYVSLLRKAMPDDVQTEEAVSPKTFRHVLNEFGPDIVHLHGTSPYPLPSAVRLVVTLHGEPFNKGLSPYVLIARSKLEASRMPFPRIEIVRNPLLTKTTTIEEAAMAMSRIYRRVMDSNVLELINPEAQRMLALALKAAITGDRRWVVDQGHDVPRLNDIDFHYLYIYARHEGVLELIQSGFAILGIPAPKPQDAESYLPEKYQVPAPSESQSIPDMLRQIDKGTLSLLALAELDSALRSDRLDEDSLLSTLREEKLNALFASVLQILSEQTLLDEGFMPCVPVNNVTTRKLRTILKSNLKL